MTEQLIIAPLLDGIVADGPLHEPAPFKTTIGVGGQSYKIPFRLTDGFIPLRWPAKCGLVGIVYVTGGLFARREMCAECASGVVTVRPFRLRETRPCPECGEPMTNKRQHERCIACYRGSLIPPEHGTMRRYKSRKYRCRCDECKAANTTSQREQREKAA